MAELFNVTIPDILFHLKVSEADILLNAGSVSHEEAEAKVLSEYEKFWRIQDQNILSDFDKLLDEIK